MTLTHPAEGRTCQSRAEQSVARRSKSAIQLSAPVPSADSMCLPSRQSCSEDDCDRFAMSATTVCFGHATVEQIVE